MITACFFFLPAQQKEWKTGKMGDIQEFRDYGI
jgi:hypothetical protein